MSRVYSRPSCHCGIMAEGDVVVVLDEIVWGFEDRVLHSCQGVEGQPGGQSAWNRCYYHKTTEERENSCFGWNEGMCLEKVCFGCSTLVVEHLLLNIWSLFQAEQELYPLFYTFPKFRLLSFSPAVYRNFPNAPENAPSTCPHIV